MLFSKNLLLKRIINSLILLLCFGLSISNVQSQTQKSTIQIKGIVYEDTGDLMVGATVQVIHGDKKYGCTSDIDGSFSINVSNNDFKKGETKLIVSFIGFKKKVLTLQGDKTFFKIVLKSDSEQLKDVVVTGYQTLDRKKVTSSVTSLNMDEILTPSMTSVTQALEGRVPDLVFMQNSGEVGATARMRVRGTSTLVGNREPLWVLDGIILQDPIDVTTDQLNDPDYVNYVGNAITGINPQDIDRIDILKDASATAIYGTRAANGVIVVTTKKGVEGAPRISYNTQLKYVVRPRYTDNDINLMNSAERVQFGKDLCDLHYSFPSQMTMVGYEGAYKRWQSGLLSYNEFEKEVRRYETVNTDWFDILTRDALTSSHTLSVSGGNRETRYYVSLGYTNENGTVKTVFNDRYTGSMNLTTTIMQNLKINTRLSGSVSKNNYLPTDIDALGYAYNTTRALPCYNEDGSLYYYKKHAYNIGTDKNEYYKYNYNILNEINNSSNNRNSNNMMATIDLNYSYNNSLDMSLTGAFQRSSGITETWYGESTNYVAQLKNGEQSDLPVGGNAGKCDLPYGGVLKTGNSLSENFTGRFQINYRTFFGDDKQHLIAISGGYEVNSARAQTSSYETRGYFKDRGMKYMNMTSDDLEKFPHYAKWLVQNNPVRVDNKTNQLSGYLTFTYSYNHLFDVNVNGRFDASNKFGNRSNEKFLPCWSASGLFNFKEAFLKDAYFIDDARIRMSYGRTGNVIDGQTPNLLIKLGTVDSYYGENVSSVATLPNPNLKWEQTNQYNLGFDLCLFENRLTLGGDFYYKKTSDAIVNVPVSTINGVSSYYMNNGNVENSGGSIYLTCYPIKTKDFSWYLSTNYSYVKNTVMTDTNQNYTINNYLSGTAIINGESIGTFYSYKFLGLNPNDGGPMFDDYYDRRGALEGKSLEEVVKTVLEKSGSREPKFSGSIFNTFRWKQFSLNTSINYSLGSKIRRYSLYSDIKNGVSSEVNVRKEFTDRWMVRGDEYRTLYPSLISPSSPRYEYYMNHWSNTSSKLNSVPTFASDYWSMYDNSNIRVVSGDYLRLSNLSLRYTFSSKELKKLPFSNLSIDLSTTNVFTLCSSKLNGQDPTQENFSSNTVLSVRPTYTFGLNVSF